mmetsp:Transcript_58736/g.134322  ORF Transcript_58736/g.134322 Transcript_58736/m.134322 type:complete len:233 (-) Transcript_58736:94-792(-)
MCEISTAISSIAYSTSSSTSASSSSSSSSSRLSGGMSWLFSSSSSWSNIGSSSSDEPPESWTEGGDKSMSQSCFPVFSFWEHPRSLFGGTTWACCSSQLTTAWHKSMHLAGMGRPTASQRSATPSTVAESTLCTFDGTMKSVSVSPLKSLHVSSTMLESQSSGKSLMSTAKESLKIQCNLRSPGTSSGTLFAVYLRILKPRSSVVYSLPNFAPGWPGTNRSCAEAPPNRRAA